MPGFDRTGPMGEGPRTGRGLGRCGKAKTAVNSDVIPGRGPRLGDGAVGGRGRGRGGGRGRRGGQGRGRMLGTQ
jgi:hypothetical protein